jgi:hypothetical protein
MIIQKASTHTRFNDDKRDTGGTSQTTEAQEQLASLRLAVLNIVQDHILPDEGVMAAGGREGPAGVGARSTTQTWIALMRHVGSLAAFLGHELASNTFVPSIMWLPNEQDWRVRAAFYEHLPELAANVVRLHVPCLARGSKGH